MKRPRTAVEWYEYYLKHPPSGPGRIGRLWLRLIRKRKSKRTDPLAIRAVEKLMKEGKRQ